MATRVEELEAIVASLRDQLKTLRGEERIGLLMMSLGLTGGQARLVALLWQRAPSCVGKVAIHEAMWGDDPNGGPDYKVIDVQVCHVRRRLAGADWTIETVWGRGYRLDSHAKAILDALQAEAA